MLPTKSPMSVKSGTIEPPRYEYNTDGASLPLHILAIHIVSCSILRFLTLALFVYRVVAF